MGKRSGGGALGPDRIAAFLRVEKVIDHAKPKLCQIIRKTGLYKMLHVISGNTAAAGSFANNMAGHTADKAKVLPPVRKIFLGPVQVDHGGAAIPDGGGVIGPEPQDAGSSRLFRNIFSEGIQHTVFLAVHKLGERVPAGADIPGSQAALCPRIHFVTHHAAHIGVRCKELQPFFQLIRVDKSLVRVHLHQVAAFCLLYTDLFGRFRQAAGIVQHGSAVPQRDLPGGVGAAAVDDQNLDLIRHRLHPDAFQRCFNGGLRIIGGHNHGNAWVHRINPPWRRTAHRRCRPPGTGPALPPGGGNGCSYAQNHPRPASPRRRAGRFLPGRRCARCGPA